MDSRWAWISTNIHDIDVPAEGRGQCTVVIRCRFRNRWRPSACFCSYVYLDVKTFPKTFAEAMSDIEMNSSSSSCLDDYDSTPRTIPTGVSFGENLKKLVVELFIGARKNRCAFCSLGCSFCTLMYVRLMSIDVCLVH